MDSHSHGPDLCAICRGELPPGRISAQSILQCIRLFTTSAMRGPCKDVCARCLRDVVLWCVEKRPDLLDFDALCILAPAAASS